MTRRLLRVTALFAVAGIALAACGDDSDDSSSDTTAASGADKGALVICTDAPYEPMEFEATEEETPSGYTGFDIDLVQAIVDGADKTLEVKVTPFDGIFAAMDAGNCDAVVSSVTITDERKQNMDFTEPYFDSDQSLMVLKENEETYKTLADLAGKNIGVQSGTTGEEYTTRTTPRKVPPSRRCPARPTCSRRCSPDRSTPSSRTTRSTPTGPPRTTTWSSRRRSSPTSSTAWPSPRATPRPWRS